MHRQAFDSRISVLRLHPVLHFGGTETLAGILADALDPDRFSLRVCTFWKAGRIASELRDRGIPVDVLNVDPSVRNARATWALWRYLRVIKPLVLHTTVAEANFHGALAGWLARVPVIVLEEGGNAPRNPLGRRLFSIAYRMTTRIIAVSEGVSEMLVEEGAPAEKIHLIHNPGSSPFFGPTCPPPANRPRTFLAVGRLSPEKNHGVLVAATALLSNRGVPVRIDIAGEGPERARLEEMIHEAGVGDRIRLLGFRPDVLELLDGSDCFLLPSFSEGLSLSLVEAMARGRPILASDVPGNREVLAGFARGKSLISPNDPLAWAEALEDVALLGREQLLALGAEARELAAAEYSPDRYGERITHLYETLLSSRGR